MMIGLVCLFAWWRSDVVIVKPDVLLVGRASHAAYVPSGDATKASVKAFRSSFPTRGRYRLIARDSAVGFAARLLAGQLAVCVLLRDPTPAGQSDDRRPLIWLPIPTWQKTRPAERVAAEAANLNAAWKIGDPPDNDGALIRPDSRLLAGGESRDFGWVAVGPEGVSGPTPATRKQPDTDADRLVVAWEDVDMIRDGQHSRYIPQMGGYDVWDLSVVLINGDTLVFTPPSGGVSRDELAFVVSSAAAHGVSAHVAGLMSPGSRHTPPW